MTVELSIMLMPSATFSDVYKRQIEKAVKAIDECVKDTVEAAKANDYEVIIIADHGNADHAPVSYTHLHNNY